MFSSTFQGKFSFQGLFKTVLYIQVLFKPVRTLDHQSIQQLGENKCDPDQPASSEEAPDMALHCFQNNLEIIMRTMHL